MSTSTALQRLRLNCRPDVTPLYVRTEREHVSPFAVRLIDLDTYFNAFDERAWHRFAAIGSVSVAVTVAGAAIVRVWRRTVDGIALLVEAKTTGASPIEDLELRVPDLPHPRAAGRLLLAVTPLGDDVAVLDGAWFGTAPERPGIGTAVVICTCNRDVPLAATLAALDADGGAVSAIAAIVVVNNGPSGLVHRLGLDRLAHATRQRLHIVDQGNVGGAGGFSRGLLEARSLPGVTHAILMDDDVVVEPEAIFRTARFYAHATGETIVGGHMLDLFRPTVLYEAGARIDPRLFGLVPQHFQAGLSAPHQLDALLAPTPVHYNGWWFMGLPLSILDRHGWPMPCFIRGDDVEFGLRLHDAGVPSTSLLGVGIWHEPFTAKLGSWHLYYECRNMLALAAWRLDASPRRLALNVARWIAADLLTYRYQRASLLIRAFEDFLSGPALMDRDPRAVHASLAALRARFQVGRIGPERVLPEPPPPLGPRNRLSFLVQLPLALASEWLRPDRGACTIRIQPRDHLWFRVRGADAVAVAEPWEPEQPLYVRSRASFRHLAARAVRLLLRAVGELRATRNAWRSVLPTLTTEAAWTTYLERHASQQDDKEPPCHSTTPAQAACPHAMSSAVHSPPAPAIP